jgi:hypothetical protein
MSQANAAARKRRAGGASLQETPVPAQIPVQPISKGGLTLPQVISLVDKRLTTLETFMKESQIDVQPDNKASEDALNTLSDEINAKFELLAGEVESLKDIVIKLQSYTMEVNKTLYEERIQVLSDMGTSITGKHDNIVFDLSEDGEDPVQEP